MIFDQDLMIYHKIQIQHLMISIFTIFEKITFCITFNVLSLELVYNPNNLNTSERTRATVQLAIMSEVRVELTHLYFQWSFHIFLISSDILFIQKTLKQDPTWFTVYKIKNSLFWLQEHPVRTNLAKSRTRRAATTPIPLQMKYTKIQKSHIF